MKNNEITSDDFKKYITNKLSSDNYTMKSKNSSIIINNYKLKNESSEPILKQKSIKNVHNESKEIDNKITHDYQNTSDDINNNLHEKSDRGYEMCKKNKSGQNKIKLNLKK